jgi:hypothetical protein
MQAKSRLSASRTSFRNALLTAAVVLAAGTGAAQANLLTNGSFETITNFVNQGNDTMLLPVGSTTMTGWTVNGTAAGNDGVAWIGPTNPFNITAQDGSYALDLTGYSNGAPYAGVQQSVATTSGDTYALTFYLGAEINGVGTYSIDACGGSTCQTFSVVISTATSGTPQNSWTLETLDFTASGPSSVVSLLGTNSGGVQEYIGLDNVSLVDTGVSATPLPAALPLFASGLAGMGLFGWRRKRKNAAAVAA